MGIEEEAGDRSKRRDADMVGGNMTDDRVREAILKVALGYSVEEVTEEYGVEDGELRLVKRRETKKDIPPDLKAGKMLLEEKDYSMLSDEELEAEKNRLIAMIKEEQS